MVSTTKLELASPQAQSARGIAALIQNAPRNKGRLVAAAAAAAAAAAIGAAVATKVFGSTDQSKLQQDDMEILYSVLLSKYGGGGGGGLTLDMIFQWNEIKNILESGILDEKVVSQVFENHAESLNDRSVILKDKFRMVGMFWCVCGWISYLFILTTLSSR
jgi:hypothetical protein